MALSPEQQLQLIRANTIDLIPEDEMLAKLRSGRPLRVKYGVDPTGPDLHIGHVVPLRKLRAFQDLGHTAVLIIGDFTGMIGDPSGRNEARPQLTRAQVEKNAAGYQQQAFKVLDPARTETHFNSEWLGQLTFEQIIRLCGTHTVAQILAREDFSKRYQEQLPIGLHELLYPLVQGYDSVAVRADVELGATEQKFNLLAGRELQVVQAWGITKFYTSPSRLTWGGILHQGAALAFLKSHLELDARNDPGKHKAVAEFLKVRAGEVQAIVDESAFAPLCPISDELIDELHEAWVRDIPVRSDQEWARARGLEHLVGVQVTDEYRVIDPEEWKSLPQVIMTLPILVGTDGVQKMGKSLDNYIGVMEPADSMFGKVMSIPDGVIQQYFELCTDVPAAEVAQMVADMKSGALNPRDAKRRLAREIVALYHSAEAAKQADETFLSVFSGSREQTREDYEALAEDIAIPASLQGKPVWMATALAELGLASSKGEARRLVRGGGVYLDERRITDPQEEVRLTPGLLLRVGKRRVARLTA